MATFTEQAVLSVKDNSTPQINKINAALKQLSQTAKSLKSTQINFGGGLPKAQSDIRRLAAELRQLQAIGRSPIAIRLNTGSAQQQLNQLRASAQRPIAVATRAAAAAAVGGGARGPGILGRVGPFGVHVLSGTVGLTLASLHALAGAIGRATKEGVKQVDIGDTALNALQLKPGERSAADAAIEAIRKAQPGTPGGALLNRGQLAQTLAETLPVAAYDPAAAQFLAERQIELIKMEVQRGRSLDQAREQSVKYIKGLELAGLLSDQAGKFDPVSATKYLDALKTIAPSIGAELTGEKFFQFWKYARSARYTLTPEGMQAGLLAAEEMGASSAGVALNQAVRQLAGQNVPKATLSELARLGLVTTKEVREGTTGKKKRTTTVVGEPLDEEGLRQNLWQFARDTLIPKMRSQGLDPNKPLDAVAFASKIASTATAKDIIAGAINRAAEIQREVERAGKRDPRLAVDPRSMLIAAEGLGSQIKGVLGEAVTAFEPVLIPALQGVGGYLSELGADIRKATTGDKVAQAAIEDKAKTALQVGGALAGVGYLTKGIVGQAIAAVAAPAGIAAGLAGAVAPGASETARSLSLAGVSLNAAGQTLQSAGSDLGMIGGVIAALGRKLGVTALVAGGAYGAYRVAEGAGVFDNEQEAAARQRTADLGKAQVLHDLGTKGLVEAERKLAEERKKIASSMAGSEDIGTHATLQRLAQDVIDWGGQIARAEAEIARITSLPPIDPQSSFWKWLEQQHKPIVIPPQTQTAVQQAVKRVQDAGKTLATLPRLIADEAKEGGEGVKGGRTRGRVPLPKPAPFAKEVEAKEGKGTLGAKAEPPPWVAQVASTIETGGSTFANVFSTGASTFSTAVTAAGVAAANEMASRAGGIGSAIGSAFAAVASSVQVNVNTQGTAPRPDTGGQQGPT